MRWLKRGAWALVVLALLACAGAATLLSVVGSERGTAWLIGRLLAGAPQVTVARVRGTLLDGIVLEGVQLRTERDELDIDSLALDWNGAAMLTRTLSFDRADASRAVYRRIPGVSERGSGPPELPWPLRLDAASIAALSVTIADRTVLLDETRFTATYGGGRLELEQVETTVGDAVVAASAMFELRSSIDVTIAGDWAAPIAGVAANGTVLLTGTWPNLRIHHELAAPFAATTDGTVALVSPASVDVVTDWQALAWPGVNGIASPSGRLALIGSLDEYRYDGSGALEVLARNATFSVAGTGERAELAIARLELTTPTAQGGGTLTGAGAVSMANRTAELAVTANGFDPAWLATAWPGRLDGTGKLTAAIPGRATARLDTIDLRGRLRGYPVTLRGAAEFSATRTELEALRLDSEANYVVLTGTVDGANIDLAVDAELEQLDLLVPNVGGQMTADLALSGTWQQPHARGRLGLLNVSFAGATLERLDASGEVGLAPDSPAKITIDAVGAARDPIRVGNLRAAIDGTAGAHSTRIELGDDDWSATITARGGLRDGIWRSTVERVDVNEEVLGPWRLEAPTAIALGRGFATLDNSCLLHVSNARWCTEFDVRGRREDRLVVSAQNFNLETLRPLLPPTVDVEGVYQLSGVLLDLMGEPSGAIALTGGLTRARVEFGAQPAFATELDRVQAGATLTDGRLELTAAVRSTSGGRAETTGSIANVRNRDSSVRGMLHVELPDLSFLTLLSPTLGEAGGALAADLNVAGTVAEPTADGRAAVTNGRIVVPQWGLAVERIEATAASSEGRTVDINATGNAGDGVLTLAGTTELNPEAGWPTRLTLRGDTVRAVQRADAEIYASPDLTIDVELPVITIAGRVDVPRASLQLEAVPAQAVTPSPDAVVHGLDQPDRVARPLQVRSNVELTLGDNVRYAGLNLDTAVTGQLRLATEPNRSASATGTLLLTGTYDAYGQRLEVERGQLLFSGPLDDPGLDVRAVRRLEIVDAATDTVEVGVELTGTLRAARTRVFSTPAMSEADALSYLLFGRPASGSGAGTEDASTLQTAALSLGLQQALPAVQRIGSTLGLDELTVRSTTTDAGALMAGKYLSPKVYIRYSYGLFNRIGGLLLRFRINDRLSIETRSGDQKSMDLLYTIENN